MKHILAALGAVTLAALPVTAERGEARAPTQGRSAASTRPDILLIVLDDVGFSDLGAFGSEIRTPNIDALAKDGLRYNRFDSKAVCTATRAALLMGRNNQTVRMADLPAEQPDPSNLTKDRDELAPNAQTLAAALRSAGYATHAVGKWHLAPEFENGAPGKNASWPLQRGFDDYYGFISGWTDQYHPDLIAGNRALPKPDIPGYHLSSDLVDHAIDAIGKPGKPNFVYLAFGVAHAPIQVPAAYADHYAGIYEKGWNAIRQERFVRLKAMGIIPANTILPPANPGDRPWSSLSDDEKAVFARFMAVYAGFIEHADEQIGRLIAALKRDGKYDNTLIMLLSDNGAASEAGFNGTFNGMYKPNQPNAAEMRARLAELGTDKTQAEYQRPWAMAGVTPYRRYKVWPYLGGVRTPLIVSWPRRIRDGGAIRHQYVDTIDIAPTLLAAAGTHFSAKVDGVRQIPVAGHNFLPSVLSAKAPESRTVQFFELRGSRAITSGEWRAVAVHLPGTDFEKDRWELFDLSRDPAEAQDLSGQEPSKLAEMKALWWREARKYSTPPISEAAARFLRRNWFKDAFPPADAEKN
jgi:arylsulfatase